MALYLLLPFFEKPGWCINNSDIDTSTSNGYWYCQNADRTIANSHIPKLPPNVTNSIYIGCLLILLWFTKARDVYRKRDGSDLIWVQCGLIIAAIIDLCITITVVNIDGLDRTEIGVRLFIYPYLNSFIRPVIFTLGVRSVKSFWRRYLIVIMGSLPMFIFIMCYVFYFAWMGNRLFAGTIEGVEYFSGLNNSFFYMFVLLTTSNFPDVMLPSYAQARHFSIFYITYLIVGLFLLMNLLLAIFYSSYQERVDASIDGFKNNRNTFLVTLFRKYDVKKEEKIDKEGVFNITKEIHSLIIGKDEVSDEMEMTKL